MYSNYGCILISPRLLLNCSRRFMAPIKITNMNSFCPWDTGNINNPNNGPLHVSYFSVGGVLS
jgi:hypothetical protein